MSEGQGEAAGERDMGEKAKVNARGEGQRTPGCG